MASFEDEVFGFMNQVASEHDEEQARGIDEDRRRQELEQAVAEREAKIRAIGQDVVDLLFRHSIQPVPIWGRKRSRSDISELGKGWHVLTVQHYPTEGQPIPSLHAVDTKGNSFRFSYTQYQRRYKGIVFPSMATYDATALSVLESESFKKGLASQISGYGPYEDTSGYDNR